MKLTANRSKLLVAVSTVLHTAGSDARGLIQAEDDGRCTLLASGNEGGALYEVEGVTIRAEGYAVFALNSVAAVLRGSTDETVDLDTLPNSRMVLRTKSGRLELPTREASAVGDGPPESDDYPEAEVDGNYFRRAVTRVAFAADRRTKGASWATTGVRIVLSPDGLTMEATDTYGLALCRIPFTSKAKGQSLVPVRSLRAWAEAARGQETVRLSFGPSLALFRAGPLLTWCPSIAGRFPETDAVFYRSRPNGLTVKPGELLSAVELTMVAADQDEGIDPRERRLMFKAENKVLEVSATCEKATARFAVPAKGFKGDLFTVPLDGRRVEEYLATIDSEESVKIRWQDAKGAIEFTTDESWYLAIPFVDREAGK